MPRCNDCNKFVPIEETDPEVYDLSVDETGHASGSVRIVNACEVCGSELREAIFDVDMAFPEDSHDTSFKGKHEIDATLEDLERTSRTEGKSRVRTFYGALGTLTLKCACDAEYSENWSDEIRASHMESME